MASCRTCRRLVRIGFGAYPFSLCGRGGVQVTTRNYSTKQESKLWQQKPNRKPRLSIILTEDVHNLGSKSQIVKVKHGYGRNYLLPQKRAVYATHHNITEMNAYEAKKEDIISSSANTKAVADYLLGKTLCVQHDPNDSSAIFEQHISMAFYKTLYLYVPLDCIELKEPITDFDSEHSVGVRLDEENVVQVPLVVDRSLTKKKQRRLEQMERFRKKKAESSSKVQEL